MERGSMGLGLAVVATGGGARRALAVAAGLLAVGMLAMAVQADRAEAADFSKPSQYNAGAIVLVKPLKDKGKKTKAFIGTRWEKGKAWNFASAYTSKTIVNHYEARTKRRYDRVDGKLAKLGRIKLRFRPEIEHKGNFVVRHNRCPEGKRIKGVVQGGYLTGTLKLKGERGYFRQKTKRAKIWANRDLVKLPKCAFRKERALPKPNRGVLFTSRAKGLEAGVHLEYPRSSSRQTLVAVMNKRHGKTTISRHQSGKVKFGLDLPALGWATIGAASPSFAGQARFERVAGGKHRFTGNLRVNFLGKPKTKLVTSKLKVNLVNLGGPLISSTPPEPVFEATPSAVIAEPGSE